jgi:two-component system LytT family response regulator
MPIDDGFSPSPARSATSARSAPSARGILVPSNGGERILDPEEIDWIEARDDVAAIHAKGRRYVVRASLTALEPRLDPAEFVRIHRSTIVRLDRIREWGPRVRGTGIRVLLKDGTELAVSRRRVARLRSLLEPGRPVG